MAREDGNTCSNTGSSGRAGAAAQVAGSTVVAQIAAETLTRGAEARREINRCRYDARAQIIRRDCCRTRELYRATLCTATAMWCEEAEE